MKRYFDRAWEDLRSGMSLNASLGVVLRPERNVAPEANCYRALTTEPWLSLKFGGSSRKGTWLRLTYRTGLSADPIRPLIRVDQNDGSCEYFFLPAPVCGSAIWIGRIPDGAERLSICPVGRSGPFAFSIDRAQRLSRAAVALSALLRSPGSAISAIGQRLGGRKMRSRTMLRSILETASVREYTSWSKRRRAPALHEPWVRDVLTTAPPIVVAVVTTDADPKMLELTLNSIWSQLLQPLRVVSIKNGAGWSSELHGAVGCWLATLRVGDVLEPHALMCLATALLRSPGAALVYADEDEIGASGACSDPLLKPNWSPRFEEQANYVSRGFALMRVTSSLAKEANMLGDVCNAQQLASSTLRQPGVEVVHVRRVLLHRERNQRTASRSIRTRTSDPITEPLPPVSIIIPSRDNAGLIRDCIESLITRTSYRDMSIIVVDNGSIEDETLTFYEALRTNSNIRVINRPMPFNFSRLVNEGVKTADTEFVLLLNNDVEALEPDWLSRVVDEGLPRDVGASGAKLLFRDGKIQHAGVVVGLDNGAGHVRRIAQDADPVGIYMQSYPHEVSAVTAACMLVRRSEFLAVGGFDEVNFPISYNDIDFCLRLRQKGFRNMMVPGAVLYHHESASRGRHIDAAARREAFLFREKWLSSMRDDPYFHPAFSLERLEAHLG